MNVGQTFSSLLIHSLIISSGPGSSSSCCWQVATALKAIWVSEWECQWVNLLLCAQFLGKFNYQRQRQTLTETVCVHRYTRKRRKAKEATFPQQQQFLLWPGLKLREGKGAKVVVFSSHFVLCSWRICMSRVHQQLSQVKFSSSSLSVTEFSHWTRKKRERERKRGSQLGAREQSSWALSSFFFPFFLNKSNRSSEALKCLVVINPLFLALSLT